MFPGIPREIRVRYLEFPLLWIKSRLKSKKAKQGAGKEIFGAKKREGGGAFCQQQSVRQIMSRIIIYNRIASIMGKFLTAL